MRSRSFFRAAAAALVFNAACGGDSTGPAIELTEDQTADMMEAFSLVTSQGLSSTGTGQLIINRQENTSGDCPNGGTFSLNGTSSFNTDTEAESGTVTLDFSGCQATSSSSGRVWTFDGDPNVTTTYTSSFSSANETFTLTMTQTGAFKASSNIGTGRCAINMTMTLSFGADAFTGSIDGSICGRQMEVDLAAEGALGNAMRKMKR